MAFFENYTHNQGNTGINQLDTALQNVENKIVTVNDQLSNLGSGTQLRPVIEDFQRISQCIDDLKRSTSGGLNDSFVALTAAVEAFNRSIENSNTTGLDNIKNSVKEISDNLSNIAGSSNMNQVINSLEKMGQLTEYLSQKSTEYSQCIGNIDLSSMNLSEQMQNNTMEVERFLNGCAGKFTELRELVSQSLSMSPEDAMHSLDAIKSTINSLATEINNNVKIGESLVHQFNDGTEAAENFDNVISSILYNMKSTLNDLGFDEVNQQIALTMDTFARLNDVSFDGVSGDLTNLNAIIDKLKDNFSLVLNRIDDNNRSLTSLSQIVNELNNGNNEINFQTNIEELTQQAREARDVIQNITAENPEMAKSQFDILKNANEEMKKMKEQMAGLSLNSHDGTAINQILQSSKGQGGLYSAEIDNNELLLNSAEKLKDALAQCGSEYSAAIDTLNEQITELSNQRNDLQNLTQSTKNDAFGGLMRSLGNNEDDYSQKINFQLLGRSVTTPGRDNINYLGNDINQVGNNAIKLENSVRQYKRSESNPYSDLTGDDLKNVQKVLGKNSIDAVAEQAKDLERLVHEFNRNKAAIVETVNKAVSTGSKDDIENAKADMQSLLSFAEELLAQTNALGDTITVKSLKQFETLPKEVQNIVTNVQDLISSTKNVSYNTIDLADAFGLSTTNAQKLNDELSKTATTINTSRSAADNLISSLSSGLKSVQGVLSSVTSAASKIGVAGLSFGSVWGNSVGYYKQQGREAVDAYRADSSLGVDFSRADADERIKDKGMYYHQVSNGLIDFNRYNQSYIGLARNVGGRVGIDGQQSAHDLTLINDQTFALKEKYGMSDATIEKATKTFYQDLGMSAKDTSNIINEMVQVAKSANVPIETYVNQMSQLAQNYKNIGLNGKDANNIMNNMILSGMNVDMAQGFATSAGQAVSTFGSNKSLNGYFGVLSGQYSNPFDAIKGGLDKYDAQGNVKDSYLDGMTKTMDTALGAYAGIAKDGSSQQWNIVYDTFMNQFGMDAKNANIATNKYLEGDKEGFQEWFREYDSNVEIVKLESQEELESSLAGMADQLSESEKTEARLAEAAYALTPAVQALAETILPTLQQQIAILTGKIVDLSGTIANWVVEHGGQITGGLFAGAALYGGAKAYKFAKNIGSDLGGIFGNRHVAGAAGDVAGEVAEHGDDVARAATKVDWAKAAKFGLPALAAAGLGYGAYKLGSGMFDSSHPASGDTNSLVNNQYGFSGYNNYQTSGYNYAADPNYQMYQQMYGGGSANGANFIDQQIYGTNGYGANGYGIKESYSNYSPEQVTSMLLNGNAKNYNPQASESEKYNNFDLGSGKENGLLTAGNVVGTVAGDAAGSWGLEKVLSKSLVKGVSGGAILGYGVGDVIYGAGEVAQHAVQGDMVGGDIQKGVADAFTGASGSIIGAAIGSAIAPGLGTVIGGILGGWIGSKASDTVSQAMGGYSSEELEFKRAVVNNPKTLLEHKNQMLGISEEQATEIDNTMKDHAGEIQHLTEEQKDAMKILVKQLQDTGMDVDSAFNSLKDLFSKENVDATMSSLDATIKKAIAGASLPNGFTEKDVDQISGVKDEATDKERQKYLNDSDYVDNALKKLGYSSYDRKQVSTLGYDGWMAAYNNSSSANHAMAVKLLDDDKSKLNKDVDKSANKAADKKYDEIKKDKKQERTDVESDVKKSLGNNAGDNEELLRQYLREEIEKTDKQLANLKKAGKENSTDYITKEYDRDQMKAYISYSEQVEKTDKSEKERDKIVRSIPNAVNLGLGDPYFLRSKYAQSAITSISDDVQKGTVSTKMQQIMDDQKEGQLESKVNALKMLDASAIGNDYAGQTVFKLSGTNDLLEKLREDVKKQQISVYVGSDGTNPYYSTSGSTNKSKTFDANNVSNYDTSSGAMNKNDELSNPYDFEGYRLKSLSSVGQMFKGKGLEGYANTVVDAAISNGVDPVLMASMMALETGWGSNDKFTVGHNPGGIEANSSGAAGAYKGGRFAQYNSAEDGINDMARLIKERYYAKGLTTIAEIGNVYAPTTEASNSNWVDSVSSIYAKGQGYEYSASAASNAALTSAPGSNTNSSSSNTNTKSVGDAIAEVAKGQIGLPYISGAEGPVDWNKDGESANGFDCSGLVSYAAHVAGLNIGRLTANDLYKKCMPISKDELQKGDLGFTVAGGKATHVAVYYGKDSGGNDQWVHAPQPGENVKMASNAGCNAYGRLPGSNGVASDFDIGSVSYGSGDNSQTSVGNIQDTYQSVKNAGIFAQGSMLYGIVPSDYASNFSNDSTKRSNYAQAVTDLFSKGGTQGLANTVYSQQESRNAMLSHEAAAGTSTSSVYQKAIDAIGTTSKGRKDYNINVKLDASNTGDSKIEKEIKSILNGALAKIEALGVSVDELQSTSSLLDSTLYNERG